MSKHILDELPDDWRGALKGRLDASKANALSEFVARAYQEETVYPPREDLCDAFRQCRLKRARVVILGQDPYHGEGQANGLSFSVRDGVTLPPSLRNIYKELADDPELQIDVPAIASGDLTSWATQGVLLLNTVLTVRAGDPRSHKRQGWEHFTDAVIHLLTVEKEAMVFVLWGTPAGKKARLIEGSSHASRHTILRSTHPSPWSAANTRGHNRAFFGSRPFSAINKALEASEQPEIDWTIPAAL